MEEKKPMPDEKRKEPTPDEKRKEKEPEKWPTREKRPPPSPPLPPKQG